MVCRKMDHTKTLNKNVKQILLTSDGSTASYHSFCVSVKCWLPPAAKISEEEPAIYLLKSHDLQKSLKTIKQIYNYTMHRGNNIM
jgi:hypothetical protein